MGSKCFGSRSPLTHICYSNIARKLWTNSTSDLLISCSSLAFFKIDFSVYKLLSYPTIFVLCHSPAQGLVRVNGCGPVAANLTPWLQNGQRSFQGVTVCLCVVSHQRLSDEWEAWGKQKLSVETSKHGLYISASAQWGSPLSNNRGGGSKKISTHSYTGTRIWKQCP